MLHTLTADITSDARTLALAALLVQLVYVDDALLSLFNVLIRSLIQPCYGFLNIKTHVATLSDAGGINDHHGHAHHLGHLLDHVGLAAASGSYEQEIALVNLHAVNHRIVDALVVIVHGHADSHLCMILTYDALIEKLLDTLGGEVALRYGFGVLLFYKYAVA